MIFDDFKNLRRYSTVPFGEEIAAFVNGRDCAALPDGEIEILGRDLFVRIAEYPTGPSAEKKFEAHKVYADLQLVVRGAEIMEVSVNPPGKPCTAYDEKADIHFFEPEKYYSQVLVSSGQFTVFFPGELHKPGCQTGALPERVKKLVFKIRMGKV